MRDTIDKILHDLLTDHAALGRLRVFEEDPRKVLQALKAEAGRPSCKPAAYV